MPTIYLEICTQHGGRSLFAKYPQGDWIVKDTVKTHNKLKATSLCGESAHEDNGAGLEGGKSAGADSSADTDSRADINARACSQAGAGVVDASGGSGQERADDALTGDTSDTIVEKIPRHGLFGYFLIVLLLFALFLGYTLVQPFLHALIMGIVVAALSSPMYRWFQVKCGGNSPLAATCVIVVLIIGIVIPVSIFVTSLIPQAIDTVSAVNSWFATTNFEKFLEKGGLDPIVNWLSVNVPFLDISELDLRRHITEASALVGQTVIRWGTTILGNLLTFFLHFLLMLLTVFFLLKDGQRMVEGVKYLVPMRERQEDSIIHALRQISRAVLVGGLLVAVLQGVVGGIGLAIVGVPALFWGTVMAFCSLIPILGTGLVWIPASVYLLVMGEWQNALLLTGWGILVVSSIDTFLRPYFMKGSSGVSIFFIFLSIIGGINVFGMLGILYGPLILSFVMVMLTIYSDEFRDILGSK